MRRQVVHARQRGEPAVLRSSVASHVIPITSPFGAMAIEPSPLTSIDEATLFRRRPVVLAAVAGVPDEAEIKRLRPLAPSLSALGARPPGTRAPAHPAP